MNSTFNSYHKQFNKVWAVDLWKGSADSFTSLQFVTSLKGSSVANFTTLRKPILAMIPNTFSNERIVSGSESIFICHFTRWPRDSALSYEYRYPWRDPEKTTRCTKWTTYYSKRTNKSEFLVGDISHVRQITERKELTWSVFQMQN